MELDDRIAITTPEGLTLDMVVAGVGSRFIAGMLDVVIEGVILLGIVLVAGELGFDGGIGVAVVLVAIFLVMFGFHVFFELYNQGRTPGKAANGIRVVRIDGRPVDPGSSVVRNLLRLIDGWTLLTAALFPVGVVTALATRHSQRLGDLAAGTVVVRERFVRSNPTGVIHRSAPGPTVSGDVAGLSDDEISVIAHFLNRRSSLAPNARLALGHDLAQRVRPRVPGSDAFAFDEPLLEWIVARKHGRA